MGSITAVAPMRKRVLCSGEKVYQLTGAWENRQPQEELCDYRIDDGRLYCPARENW